MRKLEKKKKQLSKFYFQVKGGVVNIKGDSSNLGGITEDKDILGKVIEVFDEDSCKVDEKRWQFNSTKNINFLHFVYLFLYLIKRFIWGKEIN